MPLLSAGEPPKGSPQTQKNDGLTTYLVHVGALVRIRAETPDKARRIVTELLGPGVDVIACDPEEIP